MWSSISGVVPDSRAPRAIRLLESAPSQYGVCCSRRSELLTCVLIITYKYTKRGLLVSAYGCAPRPNRVTLL